MKLVVDSGGEKHIPFAKAFQPNVLIVGLGQGEGLPSGLGNFDDKGNKALEDGAVTLHHNGIGPIPLSTRIGLVRREHAISRFLLHPDPRKHYRV